MLKQTPIRDENYLDWVRGLPCAVSRGINCQAHHLIGHGQSAWGTKASDIFTCPLTVDRHVGNNGIHILGIKRWEARHGSQWVHVARTLKKAISENVLDKTIVENEIDYFVKDADDRLYLIEHLGLSITELA